MLQLRRLGLEHYLLLADSGATCEALRAATDQHLACVHSSLLHSLPHHPVLQEQARLNPMP